MALFLRSTSFLSNHNLLNNEFMNRLLDSMPFQKFIEERGPSYRNCDVFDDLYADIQSHLLLELKEQDVDLNTTNSSYYSSSTSLIYSHLKEIADKLFKYEYPNFKKSKETSGVKNHLSSPKLFKNLRVGISTFFLGDAKQGL